MRINVTKTIGIAHESTLLVSDEVQTEMQALIDKDFSLKLRPERPKKKRMADAQKIALCNAKGAVIDTIIIDDNNCGESPDFVDFIRNNHRRLISHAS